LYCGGNQLSNLDISNNDKIWRLKINDIPSLYKVCVWVVPFPPLIIFELNTTNSPNVYFTTDCAGGK